MEFFRQIAESVGLIDGPWRPILRDIAKGPAHSIITANIEKGAVTQVSRRDFAAVEAVDRPPEMIEILPGFLVTNAEYERARWIQVEGTYFVNELVYSWYKNICEFFPDGLIGGGLKAYLENIRLWSVYDDINEQIILLLRCDPRFCEPGRDAVVVSDEDWFVGD